MPPPAASSSRRSRPDEPAAAPVSPSLPISSSSTPRSCGSSTAPTARCPSAAAAAIAAFLPREAQPWRLRWTDDFQGIPRRCASRAAACSRCSPPTSSLTATTSSGLSTIVQVEPTGGTGDEVLLHRSASSRRTLAPGEPLEQRGGSASAERRRLGRASFLVATPGAARHAGEPATTSEGQRCSRRSARTPGCCPVSWVRFQDGLVLDLARLAHGCARARRSTWWSTASKAPALLPANLRRRRRLRHRRPLRVSWARQALGFLATAAEFRARLLPLGSWLSVEDANDFRCPRPTSTANCSPTAGSSSKACPTCRPASPRRTPSRPCSKRASTTSPPTSPSCG